MSFELSGLLGYFAFLFFLAVRLFGFSVFVRCGSLGLLTFLLSGIRAFGLILVVMPFSLPTPFFLGMDIRSPLRGDLICRLQPPIRLVHYCWKEACAIIAVIFCNFWYFLGFTGNGNLYSTNSALLANMDINQCIYEIR